MIVFRNGDERVHCDRCFELAVTEPGDPLVPGDWQVSPAEGFPALSALTMAPHGTKQGVVALMPAQPAHVCPKCSI